ncbi:cytochrome-c peroxidase [Portibacter marinus]|uniref:cytochrome-c peroxidase n=1 Tax=Portibacter marinus TaxID=2898660 RepID=UPI001F29D80A|nr:cytochrome c peroxidase [Portibacter marinus]
MKFSYKSPFICVSIIFILMSCKEDIIGPMDPTDEFETLDEELISYLKEKAPNGSVDYFSLPQSTDLQNIPADPKNNLTSAKINLGKMLFHETGIGIIPKNQNSAGTYSCASCHHSKAGFQAGIKQGIGEGGIGFGNNGEARVVDEAYGFDFLDIQPIRSPSILNTAYQTVMLWNGQFGATDVNIGTEDQWALRSPKEINYLGFEGLESQAIAALKIHRLKVTEWIVEELGYKEHFDTAFPDIPAEERYNDTIAGLAIAAYERIVLADEAPFQLWLDGDADAMTEQEKKGAILFFGKANCVQCHTGPSLSTTEFYALGMKDFSGEHISPTIAQDFFTSAQGRGGFTGDDNDLYKFKVPQLYNLTDSPFYGHGGSFTSIEDVINYKNEAIAENPAVPSEKLYSGFVPKNLTDEEVDQITAFVENALYDPNLERYVPESLPSGLCFPNNDEQSRMDLDCN